MPTQSPADVNNRPGQIANVVAYDSSRLVGHGKIRAPCPFPIALQQTPTVNLINVLFPDPLGPANTGHADRDSSAIRLFNASMLRKRLLTVRLGNDRRA